MDGKGQEWTGLDRKGQEWTGSDRKGWEWSGLDRKRQEWSGLDRKRREGLHQDVRHVRGGVQGRRGPEQRSPAWCGAEGSRRETLWGTPQTMAPGQARAGVEAQLEAVPVYFSAARAPPPLRLALAPVAQTGKAIFDGLLAVLLSLGQADHPAGGHEGPDLVLGHGDQA